MRPVPLNLKPFCTLLLCVACLTSSGCNRISGRPGQGPEVVRPEQVLDFRTLYKSNCAACHGINGRNGASITLSNPVYLAAAGQDNIRETISKGVPGKLMPPFGKASGGMLTDQQINILAQGIVQAWSNPSVLNGQTSPPYHTTLTGDAPRGQQAFTAFCARCHGATGTGSSGDPKPGTGKLGSIVDSSYLALVSDQYLRTITIAGYPDEGMPDWRTDGAQPLTDQQITDIVVWLASQRTANPGQPYPSHP